LFRVIRRFQEMGCSMVRNEGAAQDARRLEAGAISPQEDQNNGPMDGLALLGLIQDADTEREKRVQGWHVSLFCSKLKLYL